MDNRGKIDAFTLLEVTAVIAILGIIVTIVITSLNRFNEQLKLDSELHHELNTWMQFRSTLWRNYYDADSMQVEENKLLFFRNGKPNQFKFEDEVIQQSFDGRVWNIIPLNAGEISINDGVIQLSFPFNNTPLSLHLKTQKEPSESINAFYLNKIGN